jgi:hypothetical protein
MASTTLNKHWALNGVAGVQKIIRDKDDIILEALYESVKKRLKKINREDSLIDFSLKSEILQDDDDKDFESPKFSNDFSAFDSSKYFLQSQRWIGHVENINEDSFTAKLTDLSNPTTYEMGEFDFDEVSPEDKELLTIGAAFYWSLGRANSYGQIEKKSILRFQRVRTWTEDDYDRILDRAEEKFNKLIWK